MIVFNYSEENYEFTEATEAQKCVFREGVFLIPANATDIEPPTANEHQVAIFDVATNAWILKPDFRNTVVYSIAPESLGKEAIINIIGVIPEDIPATLLEYPKDTPSLWDAKKKKWVDDTSAIYKKKADAISSTREDLLTDADNRVNIAEDNGLDATLIRKYRQELRDVTKQSTYPNSVVWPTLPK